MRRSAKLALARLQEPGGGIILYLAQEGRGLGLANKMRTYKLQDGGLDTVDANTTLGFDDDERDYGVAARMLQMLGCNRVVLLTNNPAKLDGLAESGIEIAGRMPIETPINSDNRRYLTAKASRSGHRLEYLVAALAEIEAEPTAGVDGRLICFLPDSPRNRAELWRARFNSAGALARVRSSPRCLSIPMPQRQIPVYGMMLSMLQSAELRPASAVR